MRTSKKYYQTPFTRSINVMLRKTPHSNAYKTYCVAYDTQTGERVFEFDKLYLNVQLEEMPSQQLIAIQL